MQRVRTQLGCEEKEVSIYCGKDITVAILDTGIIPHPDFQGRILAFRDFIHQKQRLYDDAGHGTHVAGCLAGSGFLSEGRFRGIAPACNLVIGKVLDKEGGGDTNMMLEALKWILEERRRWNIRILNISVGFEEHVEPDKIKRLLKALEEVHQAGILVVVAAGNKGPKEGSISPLGMGKQVLTVGCHDGDYRPSGITLCASYSGRGPSTQVMKKPDIVAPGTRIMAASAKLSRRRNTYEQAYEAKSGTSFAAPLVSGAAALLWEKYPFYTAGEVKRRICYSARDLGEPWGKQGWGMLDIQAMLK
ncbi:MAG: S8 family peptidase [Lachnospiraceae bacterium]|nr:S8 family peptidase [Lachnospiraceae bacterium]